MLVRLIPKTNKAKQRVKQWGDVGAVVSRCRWVQFSTQEHWMQVEAGDQTSRWINLKNDVDFDWEEVSLSDCENRVLDAMHD